MDHAAWSVRELVENGLDRFSAPLIRKFQEFSAAIV
jgi:hypothetical protein